MENRGLLGRSPKSFLMLKICGLRDCRLHVGFGPHSVEKLIVSHQPPRVLDEIVEDGKPFGRQKDALVFVFPDSE